MKPWRSPAKRRWIAGLPCILTGWHSQAAHVGGLREGKGMSQKCSDEYLLPLSPQIHDQLDGRMKLPNGKVGAREFERYYQVDVLWLARKYHARWLERKGKAAA